MKRLVSDFHAIAIKDLARRSLLPFSRYDWVWQTDKGTCETSVNVTVLKDSLQLLFPMGGQRALQAVRLTYSFGDRGGKRHWFLCPTCPRRVGVLYHTDGLPFRCRSCWGLAYASQYISRDQSYGRQLRGLSRLAQERLSE